MALRLAVAICALASSAIQAQPGVAQSQPVLDLVCATGKHSGTWQKVKKIFRDSFADGKALLGVPAEQLSTTLKQVRAELDAAKALAPDTSEECGPGKLSLQLLTMSTVEDPAALAQLFTGVERLASPVMTLIIEVPWVALVQSGWPIFGLLAQLNQRRMQTGTANPPEVDGLNGKYESLFLRELFEALAKGDGRQLEESSRIFMSLEGTTGTALAALTAVAGQAAADRPPQEKLQVLQQLQKGFQQAIGSAVELDIALGTRWPLFGLIQFVLDQLAV